jgi:hypothetical protein
MEEIVLDVLREWGAVRRGYFDIRSNKKENYYWDRTG